MRRPGGRAAPLSIARLVRPQANPTICDPLGRHTATMSIFRPVPSVSRDRRRSTARGVVPAGRLPCPEGEAGLQQRSSVHAAGFPAALNWKQGLAYSGLAPAYLRRLIKERRLVCRPFGPNGSKVMLRSELDRILGEILGAEMKCATIEEDFDFG